MNPIQTTMLGVLGGTMGIALAIIVLLLFAPDAGSASAGVVSTTNQFILMMPYLGGILATGFVLSAIAWSRKK